VRRGLWCKCKPFSLHSICFFFFFGCSEVHCYARQKGILGCGLDVPFWLSDYGFGDRLLQAAMSLPCVEFMVYSAQWRRDLGKILCTDPRGLLQQSCHQLANVIKKETDLTDFPNPAVIAAYLNPTTSWSTGREVFVGPVTSRQPDLSAIADFCIRHFSWPSDDLPHKLTKVCAGAITRALLQVSGFLPLAWVSGHDLAHPNSRCQERLT